MFYVQHTGISRTQYFREVHPAMEKTKLTVNLTYDAMAALRALADQRGVTLGQALGQAIASEKFLADEVNKGGKVLIEKPDQTIREVVLR
jgi:cysteine synthase